MSIKSIVKNKLVHNSMWLFILQIFNTLIPLVTVPYVTRLLTPAGYGVFSGALNWIVYLQVVVEYGFNLLGSRRAAISKSTEELNLVYNKIQSTKLLLLFVAAVLLIAGLFIIGIGTEIGMCMMILFLIIVGAALQATWLFQGQQNMKNIALINVISRSISVALVFLLVKGNDHLYLYCFLYAITYIISGISSTLIARYKYTLSFRFASLTEIASLLREGFSLFLSSAVSSFFSGISTTLLTLFATHTIVGVFSAIHKIPLVMNMMFSPISQAIYPYVSQLHATDTAKASRFILRILALCMVGFGGMCTLLSIFHKELTILLFGKEYASYSLVVVPLAIQTLFGIINNFLGVQKLVAAGYQSEYSKAFTTTMLLTVVTDLIIVCFIRGVTLIWYLSGTLMTYEIVLTVLLVNENRKLKVSV